MTKSTLTLFALSVFSAGALHAQSSADIGATAADADARRRAALAASAPKSEPAKKLVVPTLYDGELDDIGPQMLLLENPPHDWFVASADLQSYYTSNPTLEETDTTWSDVAVATGQFGFNGKPIRLSGKDSKLAFNGGYRYQHFQYGLLSGRANHTLESNPTLKLDALNFRTHTVYLNGEWTKGGWSAGTGVRYSAFIQNSDDKTSYQEYVPSVHGGYRFTLSERSSLAVDADADYRFTRVPKSLSGVPVEGDRNDRYDLGLSVTYTRIIGERTLVQTGYRLQYTDYTEGSAVAQPTNERRDFLHSVSLTLGYYFTNNFSVRTFGSVDFRESNEIDDYKNVSAGVGFMAMATF